MTIEVLTAPAFEPVSLVEARDWLRLEADDTDHNDTLTALIQVMREYAENLTHRALVERSLRITLPDWPYHAQYGVMIALPFPPLVSVDTFRYTDTDGVLQTLAASQYVVHEWREPALIVPAHNVTWPTIRLVPDSIQIDYTAGYATGSPPDQSTAAENIPASAKLWMRSRLATLFEQREQIVIGTIVTPLPRDSVDGLLDSLVIGTRLF